MTLQSLTSALIHYRYWILIPASLLEGPVVTFVTGTLASLGYFNPYVAYVILVVDDVMLDGAYYCLGQTAGTRRFVTQWLTKVHVTADDVAQISSQWNRHGWRTMVVGKLSYGLAPGFLMAAGIVAVPPSRFFRYALGIALLQYGVLLLLGYYLGHALVVFHAIRFIPYAMAGVVLMMIVYVRRRLRRKRA